MFDALNKAVTKLHVKFISVTFYLFLCLLHQEKSANTTLWMSEADIMKSRQLLS